MTDVTTRLRVKIRPWLRSPWTMVLAALALRLVVMGFFYNDRLDPARDHWTFGWETARVARSIASGEGFSSPYPEPTGPTTLIPPAYTYLVAGVFKLFGIYTPASALVMLTLNNLFSSLTCLPIFFIARRVFGLSAAVRAGWIWAFFPYAVALANATVWETTLTTLLFSLLVLATLRLERSTSLSAWLGYGALWGSLRSRTRPSFPHCLSRRLGLAPALAARRELHRRGGCRVSGFPGCDRSLDLALQPNLRAVRRLPWQRRPGSPGRQQRRHERAVQFQSAPRRQPRGNGESEEARRAGVHG